MIISIGIDIIEIEEIKKSIENGKRFVQRVFTEHEKEYCEHKIDKYPHYAARYAVKEAVMKALGTGWDKGVQWKHVEVINVDRRPETRGGKPEIRLSGEALKHAEEMGVNNIFVSLSHSRNCAVASVIFEGRREEG
jgi:holo-[acyl-carrier protein] synthase